ncbi:metal ABC transporter substrate-binding protein [Alkalihalobacillus sp. LMS39]|uniref:metal ABC transporter substrate-binding protein n=1 Tax=Alkalihalobacillus sp. LMS39 TaxID=2924032 RepID=UPI001FB5230C|nr:metal ABC transporter substrate-binding protein [Alkalihalobacillus sp. LMS39]UOE96198.1 metal ABC transporter substrate-binding protein [Alkalihalobacillus sp. LMS39]
MSKKFLFVVMSSVVIFLLAGCGSDDASTSPDSEGLEITTSFSILGDVISEVIGDRGTVNYIVPIGEEPHEYEPVPSDFQRVSDSDVFYVHGLNLEEWLEKLIENVGDVSVVTVSENITPIMLEGDENEPDPHAWMNVANMQSYIEVIVEDLIERDPEGEEVYRENAEAYLEELAQLDDWIKTEVQKIPEEYRVLVISEDAFKYFGDAYGFQTEGVWELNSHEEGTPSQISRVIDVVKDQNLPAVFVETTVDKRYMESVSNDSGVPIAGEVYTDAVGQEGSGAESYILMMRHNVETFVEGLQ